MEKFFEKVDLRSRKAMIQFLSNHFRYDTMSSWNRATSYAQNMKIHRVIPDQYRDKAYKLMEADGFYDIINTLIEDFDMEHDHRWQAGFNGRSGGYLVLYEGTKEVKPYITDEKLKEIERGENVYIADGIGWRSAKEAKEWIGRNKTTVGSYPGRGVDMGEDFEEWDNDLLRRRVKLVQQFDRLCDNIVACVIEMTKEFHVEEESYTVNKTRKVLAQ